MLLKSLNISGLPSGTVMWPTVEIAGKETEDQVVCASLGLRWLVVCLLAVLVRGLRELPRETGLDCTVRISNRM
jgi:hypothetical protein